MNAIIELLKNPFILIPFLIWSAAWEGIALWRAARLRQVWWFVAMLITNTLGIFEIVYILVTRKKYMELDK